MAKSVYNLTSDDNLPDQEGTETANLYIHGAPVRPDDNLPDQEGTETAT